MIKNNKNNSIKGQIITLIVVMMGGILLTATTIAGLLTFYQFQQSNDFGESTKAVYAADAELEHAIYYYYQEYLFDPSEPCFPDACEILGGLGFENNAASSAEMIIPPPTSETTTNMFISTGESGGSIRVLQTKFSIFPF